MFHEYREIISKLKEEDKHFVNIFDKHNELNEQIEKLEAGGVDHINPVEIEKMKIEAQVKSQLMEQEFQYNQQIHNMANQSIADREQNREDAKSGRISQQNSEQSKLINQRKNNLPPQKFESNEDSLDGFDLAEFNPR